MMLLFTLIFGVSFSVFGGVFLILYAAVPHSQIDGDPVAFLICGAAFFLMGLVFLAISLKAALDNRWMRKNATKLRVKIVEYDDDTSLTVNDTYALILVCEDDKGTIYSVKTHSANERPWPIGAYVEIFVSGDKVMLNKKVKAEMPKL